MVKKLLVLIFSAIFLYAKGGINDDTKNINTINKTQNERVDKSMPKALYKPDGGLDLAKAVVSNGDSLVRIWANNPNFEISFISLSNSSAILFLKTIKSALARLSAESSPSFISRNPLKYSVKFKTLASFSELDEALSAYGLSVARLDSSDDELLLYLNDSKAHLVLPLLEPDKSIMLLDTHEIELASNVKSIELSSRSTSLWSAILRVYDERLNELMSAKKKAETKSLHLVLPNGAKYVGVSDERGVSRGAMLLSASEQGASDDVPSYAQ